MIRIYLAGGWFNDKQKEVYDFLETELFKLKNVKVFSPRKETQIKTGEINDLKIRKKIFEQNIKKIDFLRKVSSLSLLYMKTHQNITFFPWGR